MIRNERQYRVTLSSRDRLTEQVAELNQNVGSPEWVVQATRSALESQILEMDEEVAEYDALRAGTFGQVASVEDLNELPKALIRARIAANLTQRDLAERLNLREQQVQRYEANDYHGASMQRIEEVMQALGVSFRGEVALPASSGDSSGLRSTLAGIGLNRETISRRFFGTADRASQAPGWMHAAAKASRVFDTDLSDLLQGRVTPATSNALFRASTAANPELVNGYARYALYLAELLATSCTTAFRPLPSAQHLRAMHGEALESAPFETLLQICWSHGIPVLPLSDPGAFYGACWRIEDRPVIALKHGVRSLDRWAFLLGHEMDHSRHPESPSVLEADLSVRDWRAQAAEQDADRFATDLLFGDSAEALVRVAIDAANGDVARLKSTVPPVAIAGNVSVGLLADHLAARVQESGINWWPAATNLHNLDRDPWRVARSLLFDFIDFTALDSLDREILIDGIGQ